MGTNRPKAADLIEAARQQEIWALQRQIDNEHRRADALSASLESLAELYNRKNIRVPVPRDRRKKSGHVYTRVIVPDSHGQHIDLTARNAFLADLDLLRPDELIFIGDHLDCGGTFSVHQRNYTNELAESYTADVNAAEDFLDQIAKRAPRAKGEYLEGNHEHHIERWAARNFMCKADGELAVRALGPVGVLHLEKRGINYYRQGEFYDGLAVPGTIHRGKCYFTHGFSHSRHSAFNHLLRVGDNVVFGHTHAVQAMTERTVASRGQGAWSYGTLAKLQPLYKHTNPTNWVHAYGVHFVHEPSGMFVPVPIPIVGSRSLLENILEGVKGAP